MKRLYFIFLFVAVAISGMAQNVGEAFYIYRNDGGFNAFFRDEVDSIAYSHFDADSVFYDEIVTQLVYTQDSIYRIPLAAIDSVGFVQPEMEYKMDVMRMNESWLAYVVAVGDNTITFKADTPKELLPVMNQVLVTETFEEPFTLGFSGRVIGIDERQEGIVFTVEEISLSDVYDHIVSVGVSSSIGDEEVSGNAPRRIWGMNTDKGVKFPLPNLNASIGPFSLSCEPSVVMKYMVCVGEANLKDYVSIQVYTTLDGSASMEVKREAEYHPEPVWKLDVPIKTSIPGLYGRVRAGGFFRTSGKVDISATQPFVINGYSSFIKAEGQPSKRENTWTATMKDPDAELSLDGYVSGGVALQLQFGIIHEKLASADITAYVGPQLSAHFSLSAGGLVDRTLYSALKNSEVKLDFGAEIIPGYRFWGGEHQEAPVSLNLGYNINHWYVVPTFSNLAYESHGASGILRGDIERNLLPKVSLGWVVYNEQDQVYSKEYIGPYRKIEDWPNKGLERQLSNLPSGAKFKAYPLVNLLGVEMRGDESVNIDTDFPVTLSDFKVTKSQHDKGAFYHDGVYYDYRFDVSVTATLDDDADGISDWGYVYMDPNGREAYISLRQFGRSYPDTRYAYFRNQAHSTCTLYGYVKYVGSDEYVYGEPHDYPLDYAETSCPDENHPHMIDLGLPSGTKWACCNVGAHAPEEYGNYYAWGETSPKSAYREDTYQYYNENLGYPDCYINIGSDIAGTGYDAATVNWGAPWRMPSLTQIRELVNNCAYTWTIQNGVWGGKFTGPNGGTVFLPAAGYRWFGELYVAGSSGYYLSSSLGESNPGGAYDLYFHDVGANWRDDGGRFYGRSVRPVR